MQPNRAKPIWNKTKDRVNTVKSCSACEEERYHFPHPVGSLSLSGTQVTVDSRQGGLPGTGGEMRKRDQPGREGRISQGESRGWLSRLHHGLSKGPKWERIGSGPSGWYTCTGGVCICSWPVGAELRWTQGLPHFWEAKPLHTPEARRPHRPRQGDEIPPLKDCLLHPTQDSSACRVICTHR